jgi:hypothetical protein
MARSSGDQQFGHAGFPAVEGALQGRIAATVGRVDVSAAVEQRLGDFEIAPAGGHVERGAALYVLAAVDGCAMVDQNAHDGCAAGPALVGYSVERGVAAGVQVCAEIEEQLYEREVALAYGLLEQGAASVAFVYETRIGEEPLADMGQQGIMAAADHQPEKADGDRSVIN